MSSLEKIQLIPHPASGPDLAPSGYFRFGFIKRKLTECDIPDRRSLKSAIAHISDEIGKETFISFFETWMTKLELVIEYEGEYLH
jgi:hypothetical protein